MQPISACTSVYDAPKGFLLSPCNQSQPVPVFMMHLRDFCSHATKFNLKGPVPVFMMHLRCTKGISALSMQPISASTSVYDAHATKGFLLSPCNQSQPVFMYQCLPVFMMHLRDFCSPCNQSLPVPVFMMHLRDFCSLHATNLSLYQCL